MKTIMSVDRKRLFNALELQEKKAFVNFTWGFQLCFPMPSLSIRSFYVNELGVDVSVPVSYRDLEILKRISEHAARTQGLDIMNPSSGCSLHINETKIKTASGTFMHSAVPTLITMVTQNLLGFKIDMPNKMMDIHLCKLVVVECGQHINFHSESEKKPGTFGIIVLTIPVEGGYSGGKINVEHEGQKHSFQFEQGSDHHFSLIAFLENCSHELEPISEGWMLAMVFHLIWREAVEAGIYPLAFPVFIKAFKEINEELISWSSAPLVPKKSCPWPAIKSESGSANEDAGRSESRDQLENPDPSIPREKSHVYDSEYIVGDVDAALNYTNEGRMHETNVILPSDSTYDEHLLFFPLQRKYDNAELSFTKLKGRDRLMAHIFQSIGYLDVHLAVISQMIDSKLDHCVDWESDNDWSDRVFRISKWIGSNKSLPLSQQFVLDCRTELVGKIDRIACVENGTNTGDSDAIIYHHHALVIQPRSQSIRHACRYQLDAVIDQMERKIPQILEAASGLCPSIQQELVLILKQVIEFSMAQPRLVWADPCPAANERSCRLLELCIKVKAKQEGLDLLQSMATYVVNPNEMGPNPSGIPNVFVEGIRDERVAKAIADFVSKISDWNTCGDFIMKFITPLHIFRRLTCFCSLAWHLFENNSFQGAQMVAERIASILTKLLSPEQTSVLNDHQISAFIYLVVAMETNTSTTSPCRIESVVILFGRLDVYRQCLLIIDLQENYYDVTNEIPSCRSLFRQLCGIVASNDLHSSSSLLELSVPLVNAYVSFGDNEMLQLLVENICLDVDSNDIMQSNGLLDSILLSPEILEVATISTLGKSAINALLSARIDQLLDTGFLPEIAPGVDMDVNADSETCEKILCHNAAFQANLASYVFMVLQMETIQDLADSHRVLLMGLMVFNLTFEQLCDLILDVRKLGKSELKSHPAAKELFLELCRMIMHFDRECIEKVCGKKIIEVLKCFVWLRNRELVQSLVHRIFLGESNDSSNPIDINIFIGIIFYAPHLLDSLIPGIFTFNTITVDALFEAWIRDTVNYLSSLNPAVDQCSPSSNSVSQESVYANIGKCFQLYIRNEKQYPHPSQYSLNLFSPLMSKLSTWRTAHLLVQIHRTDIKEESSLKESVTCVSLIRHIAQQFANRDMNELLKSERADILDCLVEVMVCLLWLGDHYSLLPFLRKICSTFQPWQENPLVFKMVSSPKVREMGVTCHYSRMALSRLVEQRITRLKMIKAKEAALHSTNTSTSQPGFSNSFCSAQSQFEEMKTLQRRLNSKPEFHVNEEDREKAD